MTAEVAALERMLAHRTQTMDPIGSYQYLHRLERLRGELKALNEERQTTGGIALFFAGDPVYGSFGIKADFAGKAVSLFQDMVSRKFAAKERGALGTRGPVAMRPNSELMITDVTRGSFGVVLEESAQDLALTETPLNAILGDVVESLQAVVGEDHEAFELFLADTDARYLQSLGDFFELLDESHATLRYVEKDADQQLDRDEVHRARERISASEIQENEDVPLTGDLYLLPASRRFELRLGDGEWIKGSVSSAFAVEHLAEVQQANQVVGQHWRVRTKTRTFLRPNRAPKTTYVLLNLTEHIP